MTKPCMGFFTNPQRKDLVEAVCAAAKKAAQMGFKCVAAEELKSLSGMKGFDDEAPDFILAFGGDGTILRAAGDAARFEAPLCGVNMGRVGFLSEATVDELDMLLSSIKEERFELDNRSMLSCRINGGDSCLCLNDILIYRESYSGVIGIQTMIDGADAGKVYADGLVVSTPTGATGYSISAGAPVIAPGLDAVVLTTICPHSLTCRPIIASPNVEIRITVDAKAKVAVDGIHVSGIKQGDVIDICHAEEKVGFVRIRKRNFYNLIKERLS